MPWLHGVDNVWVALRVGQGDGPITKQGKSTNYFWSKYAKEGKRTIRHFLLKIYLIPGLCSRRGGRGKQDHHDGGGRGGGGETAATGEGYPAGGGVCVRKQDSTYNFCMNIC